MAKNEIEIVITAKDLLSKSLNRLEAGLNKVTRSVFSLKGGLIGLAGVYGLNKLAGDFIRTGSAMDQMRISLDTITKGKGLEWFEKLNEWALKMPINTEKAVQAFTMMRAMGLKPSIEDMTTLVDATSALGGQAGTLESIARALGQIKTKGKVSAEELTQLAERGIPAYEILSEKLGLTGEQLSNIGKQGIDAGKAVEVLLEGMAERFGGQSRKIQEKWAGLMESLRSYWKEFQRLVMDSGVMEALETGLKKLIDRIDELKKKGKLNEWAKRIGEDVIQIIANVVEAIGWIPTALYTVKETVLKTLAALIAIAQAMLQIERYSPFKKDREHAEKWIPVLQEMGEGAYSAGEDAKKSAIKFAGFGVELERLANEIRNIKTDLPKTGDATEDLGKTVEKVIKKTTQETEKATIERLQAYKSMYDSLKDWGYSDYKIQTKLIDKQRKEFIKATKDIVLAEKWASAEKRKAWEEDRLRFGSFTEGIVIAYERMKRNAVSFARVAFDSFNDFVEKARSTFSNIFYDAFTGKLDSLKDYWKNFWNSMLRILSNAIAQMTINWILGINRMSTASAMLGFGGGIMGGMGGVVPAMAGMQAAKGLGVSGQTATMLGSKMIPTGGFLTTAPGQITSKAFMMLSKIPGINIIPTQAGGLQLAIGGIPIKGLGISAALGGLGYTTLGKFLGLPQGKYSGLGAGVGAMAGFALGGPIGAAIGALGGGSLGSIFGGSNAGMGAVTNFRIPKWGEVPGWKAGGPWIKAPGAGSAVSGDTLQNIIDAINQQYQTAYAVVNNLLSNLPQTQRKKVSSKLKTLSLPLDWPTITTKPLGGAGGYQAMWVTRENIGSFNKYIENLSGQIIRRAMEYIGGAVSAAAGGVFTRPTLAMVGDNPEQGEAVIPLKQGRIPVELRGTGTTIAIRELNVMPHANIDEALFDKSLDWWVDLAKERILPALNELGEARATTTLKYSEA